MLFIKYHHSIKMTRTLSLKLYLVWNNVFTKLKIYPNSLMSTFLLRNWIKLIHFMFSQIMYHSFPYRSDRLLFIYFVKVYFQSFYCIPDAESNKRYYYICNFIRSSCQKVFTFLGQPVQPCRCLCTFSHINFIYFLESIAAVFIPHLTLYIHQFITTCWI